MALPMGKRVVMATLYRSVAPIFIVEGDDIGIFSSVVKAQEQLEPEDVKTSHYRIYDATGAKLSVATDNSAVYIYAESPPQNADSELSEILKRYLARFSKQPLDSNHENLNILIARTQEIIGQLDS